MYLPEKKRIHDPNTEVAIFWDYENIRVVAKGIKVPLAEALDAYTAKIGFLRIKKIYSDWTDINKAIIKAMYMLLLIFNLWNIRGKCILRKNFI
ncbi:hypothetical protein NEF87_001057 [Candidatus Lokiarchaeum ossiferum]|uniref:Uncharacterized protein n=1 Tax=Candidatus Lokiarchaeum ossiferum TaxID=2951803 RepID=A0ABY6HPF4_9ARCH|nr:hypothetical protein NEF87_001057 [Candidatus Lokiarchaeum sp. B-35]